LKVLQINSVCGVGSTGRIATDIDKILKSQGHESYIAFGRGSARDCDTTIKIGNNIDNYLHVAETRLFDRHGWGSTNATKEFIEEIETLNPDIIHLHNIHGYYLNVEILFNYLKTANKPVVWTLHDCWPFTGHCSYFDFVGCNRWESGCFDCPQKTSYPSSLIKDNSQENFSKKKATFTGVPNLTIVTPSKWLANLVRMSFLKEYPVKVINNGIDLEVFKPTPSNFTKKYGLEDKFIILGVASIWEQRKGFEYFIDLAKTINKDEVIVLVGLNEKQIKKLPSNVVGISRTNSVQELAEIYSSAHVFINPTLEDNFPTTNLEALACGAPVITFNTGGSVESISGKCGFVVKTGVISELKEKIQTIKSNGKDYYQNQCIDHARENFNKQDRFMDYINSYDKLLKPEHIRS
jgi:putative colanic acid biosynthesis glycosyltransferase